MHISHRASGPNGMIEGLLEPPGRPDWVIIKNHPLVLRFPHGSIDPKIH